MEEMQQERVPIEGEMYHLIELFKTLGDPTRIRLMFILVKKEMSVSSLAKELISIGREHIAESIRC